MLGLQVVAKEFVSACLLSLVSGQDIPGLSQYSCDRVMLGLKIVAGTWFVSPCLLSLEGGQVLSR